MFNHTAQQRYFHLLFTPKLRTCEYIGIFSTSHIFFSRCKRFLLFISLDSLTLRFAGRLKCSFFQCRGRDREDGQRGIRDAFFFTHLFLLPTQKEYSLTAPKQTFSSETAPLFIYSTVYSGVCYCSMLNVSTELVIT